MPIDHTRVEFLAVGDASRAASVLNGLNALQRARAMTIACSCMTRPGPCLGTAELARLIDEAAGDTGGLLACHWPIR